MNAYAEWWNKKLIKCFYLERALSPFNRYEHPYIPDPFEVFLWTRVTKKISNRLLYKYTTHKESI